MARLAGRLDARYHADAMPVSSRLRRRLSRLALGILLASAAAVPLGAAESHFLSRVRRLTVDGARAGEGYWSSDGTRLVFQSERAPGNPFYQIYTLDLTTGETRRVSNGTGKTTCAFFRPGTDEIMFASTHHDPRSLELQQAELDFRASGQQRRYSWDYDPEMDIWVTHETTGQMTRLTTARGYDAEGRYSPDGQWIAFSSMRDAYNRTLPAEEQTQLERDPSYFAEIYIMRADGSEQRRLTSVPGYDGGPFFTHDGSRIVWRRFDESGLVADIYTMKPDGSDVRRLTDFGAMSWAPYEHPSGAYFIFASNKLGFENFELFMVDAAGAKEPVRVTYSDGFDGLPVPSPDGRMLAWTSSRAGGSAGQIFLAQWNHANALAALADAPPRVPPAHATATTRDDVETLASAAMDGRLTGSPGAARASDYLVAQLQALGARPLPGHEYRLAFDFTAGTNDAGSSIAIATGGGAPRAFTSRARVQALSFSDSAEVSGPVMFAGYGIVVPDSQDFGYDSYQGLDVTDKIVVVLRYFPEDADQQTRGILARYSGLRYKALQARQRGARALVVITGPRSPNAGEVVPMTFDTALAGSGIVAVSGDAEVAGAIFAAVPGRTLEAVQQSLDDANPHVGGFAIDGLTVTVRAAVQRETQTGHNVVAYLPGSDTSIDKPWIALGAHYDHLGHGENGNSLAHSDEAGHVHFGADDNASGSAAVLGVARALAGAPHRRNLLLSFWSGEELGLLGSAAFVAAPPMPPADLAAYFNFDMVGRMQDNKLTVQATGSSDAWPKLLEQANVLAGFDLLTQADPYQPTDVATFNQAEVPSLAFFTGTHPDYHRPTDTLDKINFEDLDRVVDFAASLIRRVDSMDAPPAFVRVEQQTEGGSRDGLRLFTGTIPNYSTDVAGLLLDGVIAGGPAEAAGLQKGDIIVEIGGQSIANIYDYTYALDVLKIGEPATVVFTRGGERKETTLTPAARK